MLSCVTCGYNNRAEARFCIMCGKQLASSTLNIPKDQLNNVIPEVRWGTILFEEGFELEMQVGDRSLIMPLVTGHNFTVGRGVPSSSLIVTTGPLHSFSSAGNGAPIILDAPLPHIDLTLFGASDAGVSRMHARLRHEGHFLTVEDLGSTNGTRLNGGLLIPHKKRLLRNEDELLLGFLSIKVLFQSHQLQRKAS